jgi:hypothetical protein
VYKRVYPEHTELRERLVNKRRPFFEIPGPDYVWSFDGYDKLKRWGFEIYAGIDAYSRFIVTLYVGTSNSTGRSVIGQYVQLVEALQHQPRRIRCDRGPETGLLATAQWYLLQDKSILDGSGTEVPVEFRDVFIFGPSTKNQRIEAWWSLFSRGATMRWRVCTYP